jgi:RNA polymerase sigma-70 factor (ECF subfamily)
LELSEKETMLRLPLTTHSDDELVQSICRREEWALDVVIRIYGGQVNALCRRICVDELEANGVFSEVFWELWRNASMFQSRRGSLRSYLLTMARSRALDRYRAVSSQSRKQHRFLEAAMDRMGDFTSNESPDERPIQEENSKEVHSALSQLPQMQQQALFLTFFDGLSHREVSQELGVPLGSVKTSIRSGLLKLRRLLASLREPQETS